MGSENPVSMDTEHYGLTGRPFQLTPDASFWYESATHRKAMAYLGYGLALGEGFIVITGEIGAGKTTLLRALAGLVPITAGEAIVLGVDLRDDRRAVRHRVGLLAHGTGLYDELTVADNVRFWTQAARADGTPALFPPSQQHPCSWLSPHD